MALNDIHGYCKNCNQRFIIDPKTFDLDKCYKCGGEIIWSNLTVEEWVLINHASEDQNFLKAMMKLKDDDIINFSMKISQLKSQAIADGLYGSKNKGPKCPKCGGQNITTGSRGVSGFWGFIGANRTVNRCGNCGYTWSPRG